MFFLGGGEGNLRSLGTGLLLVVAVAEADLLAESLARQVVQVGGVWTELEAHAQDVLRDIELLRALRTALLVLDRGIEDADAVELDAVALAYQLGDAFGQLAEDGLHFGAVTDETVFDHVLGEASCGERSLAIDVGEPTAIDAGALILDFLEHVAHGECVFCHSFCVS